MTWQECIFYIALMVFVSYFVKQICLWRIVREKSLTEKEMLNQRLKHELNIKKHELEIMEKKHEYEKENKLLSQNGK